jgi:hypothetical protein
MLTSPAPSSEWQEFTYTGDCWQQWDQYWSPSIYGVALATSTRTDSVSTQSETTYTTYVGGKPSTSTAGLTTISYYGASQVYTDLTTVQTAQAPSGTPECTLPSIVPQCQAQWTSWLNQSMANNNIESTPLPNEPSCTQVSIGSQLCTSLAMVVLEEDPAETAINWGHKTLSPWPSASSLAPGCSLGCQQCSITGNTVQLFVSVPIVTIIAVGNG